MESLGNDAEDPAAEVGQCGSCCGGGGGSLTHAVMVAQSTNMSPATIRTLRLFCPSVIHQILRLLLGMLAASVYANLCPIYAARY